MKRKISFDIECGKTTCASKPGDFCRFFRGSLSGKEKCYLFGKIFEGDNGWIQRHPDCIKIAKEQQRNKNGFNKTII